MNALSCLPQLFTLVYIDDAWVAAEYQENAVEAVKCWNLERILDNEQCGQPMLEELTMDDLVNEDNVDST